MKFLVAVFILLFCHDVFACGCISRRPNVKNSFEKSVMIFSGTVEEITPYFYNQKSNRMAVFTPDINSELEPLYYDIKLRPKKYWKGEGYKEVIVETNAGSSGCGYNFREGEDYLVYVHEIHEEKGDSVGKAAVWKCGRTGRLKKSYRDIIKLNSIKKSYSPTIEVQSKNGGH